MGLKGSRILPTLSLSLCAAASRKVPKTLKTEHAAPSPPPPTATSLPQHPRTSTWKVGFFTSSRRAWALRLSSSMSVKCVLASCNGGVLELRGLLNCSGSMQGSLLSETPKCPAKSRLEARRLGDVMRAALGCFLGALRMQGFGRFWVVDLGIYKFRHFFW